MIQDDWNHFQNLTYSSAVYNLTTPQLSQKKSTCNILSYLTNKMTDKQTVVKAEPLPKLARIIIIFITDAHATVIVTAAVLFG